jgi:hypothetical protein
MDPINNVLRELRSYTRDVVTSNSSIAQTHDLWVEGRHLHVLDHLSLF